MNESNDDLYNAGRLIQFALQPAAAPERNEEYNRLIELYLDCSDFRVTVEKIADGLGLRILGEPRRHWSLLLAPQPESIFSVRSHEYRAAQNYKSDRRLVDGLIHVAIAATFYPRDADLLEYDWRPSETVTVDDIEKMLRQIVERLEEESRTNPDPPAGAEGLYEAWRVYKNFPETKATKNNRHAVWTTRAMIEKALEYLSSGVVSGGTGKITSRCRGIECWCRNTRRLKFTKLSNARSTRRRMKKKEKKADASTNATAIRQSRTPDGASRRFNHSSRRQRHGARRRFGSVAA